MASPMAKVAGAANSSIMLKMLVPKMPANPQIGRDCSMAAALKCLYLGGAELSDHSDRAFPWAGYRRHDQIDVEAAADRADTDGFKRKLLGEIQIRAIAECFKQIAVVDPGMDQHPFVVRPAEAIYLRREEAVLAGLRTCRGGSFARATGKRSRANAGQQAMKC